MSTPRAYTHACVASLPVWVACGGVLGGGALAARVALAGAVVLLNLLVAERIVSSVVQATADGGRATASGLLLLKQLSTLPVALVLLFALGAPAVTLAWLCLPTGALVSAGVVALNHRDLHHLARLAPRESRC